MGLSFHCFVLLLHFFSTASAFTLPTQQTRAFSDLSEWTLQSSPAPDPPTASDNPTESVPCPNCDKCDGSGRIMGGLGAFPLTSWWPIKVK